MNRQVEEILDRCIHAARSGKDPEAILREHPEAAEEVRPLLQLASALQSLPAPVPRVARMMSAVAKAATEQTRAPAPSRHKRKFILLRLPVLARAAILLLAALGAGWGTVGAASSAVPGDLLYGVKRLAEQIRFSVTVSPENQAHLLVSFSNERLREVVKKHERGGGIDAELLTRMLDHARDALVAGTGLSAASRNMLAARVASLHRFQGEALEHLEEQVTPQENQVIQSVLQVCRRRCECLAELQHKCKTPKSCEKCKPEVYMRVVMRLPVQAAPAPPSR